MTGMLVDNTPQPAEKYLDRPAGGIFIMIAHAFSLWIEVLNSITYEYIPIESLLWKFWLSYYWLLLAGGLAGG